MKLSFKDLCLILLVVLAWGFTFVVIKVGLQGVPPFLLAALRFAILLIPALFVPFPKVKVRWLLSYMTTVSFLQFAFLFNAIDYGMPAGLSSVVTQSQVFFTLILTALFLGERLKPQSCLGILVSMTGLIIVAMDSGVNSTFFGFMLTLLAAFSWSLGNMVIKKVNKKELLRLTVWGNCIAFIPFSIVSVVFEGTGVIRLAFFNMSWTTVLSVLYLSLIATIFGYGIWAKLLAKYPTGLIAPFTVLTPIFGLSCAALVLNEHLTTGQLLGASVVILGLFVNVFGTKLFKQKSPKMGKVY